MRSRQHHTQREHSREAGPAAGREVDRRSRLHDLIGNRAMIRLARAAGTLRAPRPQSLPGVTVGHHADHHEHDADRRAEALADRTGRARTGQGPATAARTAAPATSMPAAIRQFVGFSSGRLLPGALRAEMEQGLGCDLSAVRLHEGPGAARAAAALGARAFTVGTDVVFARGELDPSTPGGRRVLAHELAHVAQQASGQAHAPTGTALVQRKPGENAQESWSALIDPDIYVDTKKNPDQRNVANEAIRRMLAISEAQSMINELYNLLCPKDVCKSVIRVLFEDSLEQYPMGEGRGFFEPAVVRAPNYQVHILNQRPSSSRGSATWEGINLTYTDPSTMMADALYHELLHVWFVNKLKIKGEPEMVVVRPGSYVEEDRFKTGHQGPGMYDQRFWNAYKAFNDALHAKEADLRAELEAAANKTKTQTQPKPDETVVKPPPPPAKPGDPWFGGDIYGGFYAGKEGRIGPVIGGGVTFRTIPELSIGLGLRGIYLSPPLSNTDYAGNFFGGGALSLRYRAAGGGWSWYVDGEGGVLGEISPDDTKKITDKAAGMVGFGVGMESGEVGPRFFWRLGGIFIISDQSEPLPAGMPPPEKSPGPAWQGGGVLGAGARF